MVHALDLLGTFAFALSGALLAARKRMDVFGVVVLAIAARLGRRHRPRRADPRNAAGGDHALVRAQS